MHMSTSNSKYRSFLDKIWWKYLTKRESTHANVQSCRSNKKRNWRRRSLNIQRGVSWYTLISYWKDHPRDQKKVIVIARPRFNKNMCCLGQKKSGYTSEQLILSCSLNSDTFLYSQVSDYSSLCLRVTLTLRYIDFIVPRFNSRLSLSWGSLFL